MFRQLPHLGEVVLCEVLEDGVGQLAQARLGARLWHRGQGEGGGEAWGKLFFKLENQGSGVSGVKAGNDGGSFFRFRGEDVCSL